MPNYEFKRNGIVEKIELRLVETKSGNELKYYLKKCCPSVVNLCAECPPAQFGDGVSNEGQVAIKIPNCFEINGDVYELKTGSKFSFVYENLTTGDSKSSVTELNGYTLITLNISSNDKENVICLDNICIPVEPLCFRKKDGVTVNLMDIAEFIECEEPDPTLPSVVPTEG